MCGMERERGCWREGVKLREDCATLLNLKMARMKELKINC